MFDLFQIVEKMIASYHLKLFSNMHQHGIFSLNYLKSAVNDSLSDQKQKSLKLIIIGDKKV